MNVVLVRETPTSKEAISTFDYSDLNAYLLVVVGLAKPDEEHVELYANISKKAQAQEAIPLREIQQLSRKEPLCTLPADATLDRAMEAFGSGIHRITILSQTGEVVGVLSQLRLVEFFWHEAGNFPAIERLYGCLLRDLQIGTHQIIAIK
jgi:CBS domain-containing protein